MSQSEQLEAVASRFGTPAYIYDVDVAGQRVDELRTHLPGGAKILYSFKANGLPCLAAALNAKGCRADVASSGELRSAQSAGFDMSVSLFGGPAKTVEEIRAALSAGVVHFSAESLTDLGRIAAAAKEACVRPRVLVRVNPEGLSKGRITMTGTASQFGVDEALLISGGAAALDVFAGALDIIGWHYYLGSQMQEVAAIAESLGIIGESVNRLGEALGIAPDVVNCGGGFGWPYATRDTPPGFSGMREALDGVIGRCDALRQAELWFESGRYLTASCGTLLARVQDVKQSKGRTYVVLDTGIHHLGGMSGLGRIPRPFMALEPVRPREGGLTVCDVAGPLCTPLDCMGRNLELPPLLPGDLVAVPNVGAYGLGASLVAFLGRPAPVEVAVSGGRVVAAARLATGHVEIPVD